MPTGATAQLLSRSGEIDRILSLANRFPSQKQMRVILSEAKDLSRNFCHPDPFPP